MVEPFDTRSSTLNARKVTALVFERLNEWFSSSSPLEFNEEAIASCADRHETTLFLARFMPVVHAEEVSTDFWSKQDYGCCGFYVVDDGTREIAQSYAVFFNAMALPEARPDDRIDTAPPESRALLLGSISHRPDLNLRQFELGVMVEEAVHLYHMMDYRRSQNAEPPTFHCEAVAAMLKPLLMEEAGMAAFGEGRKATDEELDRCVFNHALWPTTPYHDAHRLAKLCWSVIDGNANPDRYLKFLQFTGITTIDFDTRFITDRLVEFSSMPGPNPLEWLIEKIRTEAARIGLRWLGN